MNYPNAGKVWLSAEDDTLRLEFRDSEPLADIVRRHGRTPGAIMGRMLTLGLVKEGPVGYYRIEQDPFITFGEVKRLTEAGKEKKNA